MGLFDEMTNGQKIVLGIFFIFIICLGISMCYRNKLLNTLGFEGFFAGEPTTIYLLKQKWCSHCKAMLPEFKKLQEKLKENDQFNAIAIEGTEESKTNEDWIRFEKAGYIKGFPTILIVKGGKVTKYEGERTAQGMEDFLKTN